MNKRDAIIRKAYDKLAYEQVEKKSTALQKHINMATHHLDTSKDAAEDMFSLLYQPSPKLRNASDMADSHQLQRRIMGELHKSDEVKTLRKGSQLDDFASHLGTMALVNTIPAKISEQDKKDVEEATEAARDAEEELDRLIEEAEQAESEEEPPDAPDQDDSDDSDSGDDSDDSDNSDDSGDGDRPPGGDGDPTGPSQDDIDAAKDKVTDAWKDVDRAGHGIAKAVREATDNAEESQDEYNAMLQMAGKQPGEGKNMAWKDKEELYSLLQNSDGLKEIIKLAGRFKRMALHKQRTKTTSKHTGRIVAVERGNDIARVLPTEVALYARGGSSRSLFLKKFNEKKLMQYKVEAQEIEGEGPICICVDFSGSMYGNNIVWAKSLTVAIVEVAKKQNRAVRIIPFEYNVRDVIDLSNDATERGKQLFKFCSRRPSGGTSFDAALSVALDAIEGSEFDRADIIFITDGEDYFGIGDRYNKVKAEKQFSPYGIAVGMGREPASMKEFCDEVAAISDIAEEIKTGKAAQKLFGSI